MCEYNLRRLHKIRIQMFEESRLVVAVIKIMNQREEHFVMERLQHCARTMRLGVDLIDDFDS